MNDIRAALKYLERDFPINASIIDPIKQGTADVLYASCDCAFLRGLGGVYMLQTTDLILASKLISKITTDVPLVTHSKELTALAIEEKGYNHNVPCYQAVYLDEPPELKNSLEIRPLREDEVHEAVEMYHFDLESALMHIRCGLVYGGIYEDKIVGMVGFHYQGSMGMLSVKPEFRRMGFGEELEKFIIRKKLGLGGIPYCQVVEGNSASLALQRKLGLRISANMLSWLSKR